MVIYANLQENEKMAKNKRNGSKNSNMVLPKKNSAKPTKTPEQTLN